MQDLADPAFTCACCRYFLAQCKRLAQKVLVRFSGQTKTQLHSRSIGLGIIFDDAIPPDLRISDVSAQLHLPSRLAAKTSISVLSCPQESKSAALPAWRTFPTSIDDKLMQIRTWLEVCERDHPACRPIDRISMPTRLIKLDLNASTMVAKLVQAAELGGSEPTYTALSYCWGDTRPFRLLQGNHEALTIDIPWAELPLTVRDAMCYTKALNIGYIWIDSLCIIQDDVKD
ncbi:hypothetical protein LTR78_005835 [Recurvomyces mirabilis]|uniref:Heterokaryon incompatibility domain-containing protein n=1 Tax=Recurvomyces mirabilis TaxID=574656 RepID=A0AAE1C153_9PEZI|nr:hypothetical protein LTR78_005835 [Recurvomyces mirabilis]KAK5154215.1 hypothetical protein LTS14_006900 [Recurvomyces mirabilis]